MDRARREPAAEHHLTDGRQQHQQHPGLTDPAGAPGEVTTRRPREQHRGDNQRAHRVPQPPLPPEGSRDGPNRGIPQAEAGDADGGAHRGAQHRRQRDKAENVLRPLERRSKARETAEQVGARDRLQRVPHRDAGRHGQAHARGRVDEEGPQRDARPEPGPEEQERGERDPRGRPYQGHTLVHGGQGQSERRGGDVDGGEQSDEENRGDDGHRARPDS